MEGNVLDLGCCNYLQTAFNLLLQNSFQIPNIAVEQNLQGMPLVTLGFKINSTKINAALASELRNLALGQIHLEVYGPSDFCVDSRLRQLSGLPIARLDLSGTLVKSPCLKRLRELPGLTDLDLSRIGEGDCFRDSELLELHDLPLARLNLQGRGRITHTGLEVLRGMPLASLNLRACVGVYEEGLAVLPGLPLTQLDVSKLRTYVNVVRELPGLVDLTISQHSMRELLPGLPLTKLCINKCYCGELGVVRELPQLVDLCLVGEDLGYDEYGSRNRALENAGLQHLRDLSLRVFSLQNVHSVTDAGLEVLRGMTSLKWMYFHECPLITPEGLATFGKVEVEGTHMHVEI